MSDDGGRWRNSGAEGVEAITEHVYDTRALTDDQRSLADDIASAMGYGHEDSCAVWWEDSDGCSCPLLQSVADGLNGARVVEIIQEWGYDPATQRGDRLQRQSFRPHPLDVPPDALREQVAYGLSTHLCYSGVRPGDKSIDVFIERFESYTPEKEQRRQTDLDEAYADFMAAQVEP